MTDIPITISINSHTYNRLLRYRCSLNYNSMTEAVTALVNDHSCSLALADKQALRIARLEEIREKHKEMIASHLETIYNLQMALERTT